MRVHIALVLCLFAAGCAAPKEGDEKDAEKERPKKPHVKPFGEDGDAATFLKSQTRYENLFGHSIYLSDEPYSLSCTGFLSDFLTLKNKNCVAVMSDLDFENDATVYSVTDAERTFAITARKYSGERVTIGGTDYICLSHTGRTYKKTAKHSYEGDFDSHMILTTKMATKPSELDESAVFAVFSYDATFCANRE